MAGLILGMAALFSLLAPVHVLDLRRDAERGVRADISRRVLFVLPIHHTTVEGVEVVGTSTFSPARYTKPGQRDIEVQPEQEGTLVLEGRGGSAKVSTSPANVYDIEREVRAFIDETKEPRYRAWLVSNWKFGVVVVSVVAVPGLLIVLGVLWDLIGLVFNRRSVAGARREGPPS